MRKGDRLLKRRNIHIFSGNRKDLQQTQITPHFIPFMKNPGKVIVSDQGHLWSQNFSRCPWSLVLCDHDGKTSEEFLRVAQT